MTTREIDKIKTITSYTGLSRFLEDDATPYGWIPRNPSMPKTPYSSGPTHRVYLYRNMPVVCIETSHKRYEIFKVPDDATIYHTDSEAEDVFVAQRRACAWMP